jgi:hypothetical protein
VHGASPFCVYELQVENYGKDLASSNRSTRLSESRARNLSSTVFVVWQRYGPSGFETTKQPELKVRAVLTENSAQVPFHRAVFDQLGEDLV